MIHGVGHPLNHGLDTNDDQITVGGRTIQTECKSGFLCELSFNDYIILKCAKFYKCPFLSHNSTTNLAQTISKKCT